MIICAILFTLNLLCFRLTNSQPPLKSDTCYNFKNLPTSYSVSMICYNAVDYDFFLSSNSSLSALNDLATASLSDERIRLTSQSCQMGFIKMICSNVYLKCQQNIKLNDFNKINWNYKIYSDVYNELNSLYLANLIPSQFVPVPFQRPCKLLCSSIPSICIELVNLVEYTSNCDDRYDYSFGSGDVRALYTNYPSLSRPFLYDASNNGSICNAMTTNFAVATTKETYLQGNNPKGACYGITKELYIPSPATISSLLSPLLSPYVIQTLLEKQLSTTFASLPVWISQSCHTALKRYFCGSYMLAPHPVTVANILFSNNINSTLLIKSNIISKHTLSYSFSIPSYPHQNICTEYLSECSSFIGVSGIPALSPHCTAFVNGITLFPSINQTVSQIALQISNHKVVAKIDSPPNQMLSSSSSSASSSFGYTTQCPIGFVVPNHEDSRTSYISGSGCAMSCQSPFNAIDEWNTFTTLNIVTSWLGLPMVIFLLITWLLDKERRQQYLIITFAGYSGMTTLVFAVFSLLPFESTSCATNAVAYDETDGLTPCGLQLFIIVLGGLGTGSSWAMLSVDLFLKIVLGYRNTNQFKPYFISFVILVPVVFTAYGATQPFTVQTMSPMCFVEPETDWTVFFYPLLAINILGVSAILPVIGAIIRSIYNTMPKNSIHLNLKEAFKGLKLLKTPLIFTLLYLTMSVSYISYRYSTKKIKEKVIVSFIDFITCIFTNFDGTDSSWQSVCGNHASIRFGMNFGYWIYVCVSGQSILICSIYLINTSIYKFWWKYFIKRVYGQTAGVGYRTVAAQSVMSVRRASHKSAVVAPSPSATTRRKSSILFSDNPAPLKSKQVLYIIEKKVEPLH